MNTILSKANIVQFIEGKFDKPFDESNTKLLFDYYRLNQSNDNIITKNEFRSLLFDLLLVNNWPLVIPDDTLNYIIKKLSWNIKSNNIYTNISWKEFKSFFKQLNTYPLHKLFNLFTKYLNIHQNINKNILSFSRLITITPIFYGKYCNNQNSCINWKEFIQKLVPQTTQIIFKYVNDDIYGLLIGPLALLKSELITININNAIYAVSIQPFNVFNNCFQSNSFKNNNIVRMFNQSSKRIQINFNNSKQIECYQHISIGALLFMIQQWLNIPNHCKLIVISNNNMRINQDKYKYKHLNVCNISDNSSLFVYVCDYNNLLFENKVTDINKIKLMLTKKCSQCNNIIYKNKSNHIYGSQCPACNCRFCWNCNSLSCTKNVCQRHEMIRIYITTYMKDIRPIDVSRNINISKLFAKIAEIYKIANKSNILLVNNHLIINRHIDNYSNLSHYNITNNSCLVLCTQAKYTNKKHNDKLSKIQQDLRLNCSDMIVNIKNGNKIRYIKDLDILTYELNNNCIQMNCGHGITKQALYHYTLSQLKDKKTVIKCPHILNIKSKLCDTTWYYPQIKHILHQSANDERKYNGHDNDDIILTDILKLEIRYGLNTIHNEYKTKACPSCKCLLYRNANDHNKYLTVCPYTNCNHIFCWNCDSNKCTVYQCIKLPSLKNEVLKILTNCELKKIGSVKDVPSIRCCPKCLQLINHTDACKHVDCKSCKTSFCFVCMKIKLDGDWQCGSHSSICPIAPIEIPNVRK